MENRSITVKGMDIGLWADFRMLCLQERKTIIKRLTEMIYVATSEIREMDKMYKKSQPWNNGPGDESEEESEEEESKEEFEEESENESKDESEHPFD